MTLKAVPFSVALTFSRPSPADYEDINGDTQTAGVDVPRFNYSAGVAEGLLLDASLSETAAINNIPNFNSSSGTWVIKADLEKSKPIPGSGFGEFMEGSGTLVFVYSDGVGKCWADGEVLFAVDPFSPAEPGFLSNGGLAKIQDLTYYPYAWTDEEAAAKSSGEFSIYFGPEVFFADGTDGFWGDSTDGSTLFQESAGTTPAGPGDPCGLRIDKSGNGNDQTQSTTAAKPTVQTVDGVQALTLDSTDDDMRIDVPTGGWSGTFVQGTALGVIVGEIDVPEGPYQIPTDPNYAGPASDIHTIIVNRTLAENEVDGLVDWVGQRCPVADFSTVPTGITDGRGWFRNRTDLTRLDCSRWRPEFEDVREFARGASNVSDISVPYLVTASTEWLTNAFIGLGITSIDVSHWVTSGLILNAINLFSGCTNLETVIVYGGTGSPFSDSPCINYRDAFANTNLSQQSYTDIVTAIEAAGTSSGTLGITGGSATTTGAAKTAVDALRGRGWTVTTPDGY